MVIRFKATHLWLNDFSMVNGLHFAWDKGENPKRLCNMMHYGQNINAF